MQYICYICKNNIGLGQKIYFVCDKYTCSKVCSDKYFKFIQLKDPNLSKPLIWNSYKMSDISYNLESSYKY